MARKKEVWNKTVDENLKKNLMLTAYAAYENGCELSKDARILFDAQRYSRATALAILAEEEFCKAFTLKMSADNYRWDSRLYLALRNHANKQGLAEALMTYTEYANAEARLIGLSAWASLDEGKLKEVVAAAKERLIKPVKDYLKQDSLYVSISEDGAIKSQPKDITKEYAESSLVSTRVFQTIVATALGDESVHEEFLKI